MTLVRSAWLAFGCLVFAIGALGWITLEALRQDRAEYELRRENVREENVRLALWRMDSALGPLFTQESARPYFVYEAFYAADRAYTREFSEIETGTVLIPSPLLTAVPPHVRLHFQVDSAGGWTSPQVPVGAVKDLAAGAFALKYDPALSAALLGELETALGREWLLERLPREYPATGTVAVSSGWSAPPVQEASQEAQVLVLSSSENAQYSRNTVEQQFRVLYCQSNDVFQALGNSRLDLQSDAALEGLMEPLWADGRLILARRVRVRENEYVQGCWFDWKSLEAFLLERVKDLLPGASLEPVAGAAEGRRDRMLAALPVELVAGEVLHYGTPASRLLESLERRRESLALAWGCLILATVAVGLLLRGVAGLSERRGAFVSAVTHELRTPLTTLRMYTEMLASGMVKDAAKRRLYLEKLQSEADRLGHLVENVLAYARIERGRAPARLQRVTLAELVERSRERLVERVEGTGMTLVVEADAGAAAEVMADPAAVDQILFNLVDNACKYARRAEDSRVHVDVLAGEGDVGLEVRDHGAGVPAKERRHLFQPFTKSDSAAAATAPGVGLGLALSRQLARSMGGDLVLVEAADTGTAVRLTLPRAPD